MILTDVQVSYFGRGAEVAVGGGVLAHDVRKLGLGLLQKIDLFLPRHSPAVPRTPFNTIASHDTRHTTAHRSR